jgi:hypothetical protein
VAWDHVCSPKAHGGLNLISLEEWNQVNLAKLLWNINSKADSLWIRWIHIYYIKNDALLTMPVSNSCSWIWKVILKQRDTLLQIQGWEHMKGKMITRMVYKLLRVDYPSVAWKVTMYHNFARPRAIFTFWLACHGRLTTKDRLRKFGLNVEVTCCFCNHEETVDHLFFSYNSMKVIVETKSILMF